MMRVIRDTNYNVGYRVATDPQPSKEKKGNYLATF